MLEALFPCGVAQCNAGLRIEKSCMLLFFLFHLAIRVLPCLKLTSLLRADQGGESSSGSSLTTLTDMGSLMLSNVEPKVARYKHSG